MRRQVVWVDVSKVDDILNGSNPNGHLYATPEECFNKINARECQAIAIIRNCDLDKLEHKLKIIKGLATPKGDLQ